MKRNRLPYGHINGRPPEVAGLPGEMHSYARTPNLAELRKQAGITDEEAEPLLKQQGYGLATLHALESGEAMSRLTISRITAVLGLSHAEAKEGFE